MTDIVKWLREFQHADLYDIEMGMLDEVAAEITRLRALLPEGMEDRRIIFEECEAGHGSLRGENWVKNDCPWCQIARLRAENERLRGSIHALEAKALEHHQENIHRAEWRGSDNAQRKAKAVVARSGVLLSDIRKIAKAALKGNSDE